jgi:hypothetical protein
MRIKTCRELKTFLQTELTTKIRSGNISFAFTHGSEKNKVPKKMTESP